jgi:hypothetical protein
MNRLARNVERVDHAALIVVMLFAASGCRPALVREGPVPQFVGEYHIADVSEPTIADDAVPLLGAIARLQERVSALAPQRPLGTVTIAAVIGSEYAEWRVRFNDPDHEYRMVVGPQNADGTFGVWRFEQTPAPKVRAEGVARLDRDTLIAEFGFTAETSSRSLLRERWIRHSDGRLEFALETRAAGGSPRRLGGFVARPIEP